MFGEKYYNLSNYKYQSNAYQIYFHGLIFFFIYFYGPTLFYLDSKKVK